MISEVFPNPNYSVIPWLFSPNPVAVPTPFLHRASKSSYLSIDGSNFPNQLQMLMNRDELCLPTATSVSLHETRNKLHVDLMVCTKNFTRSWGGAEGEYFFFLMCFWKGLDWQQRHAWGWRRQLGEVGGFLFAARNCQLRNSKEKKNVHPDCDCCWLLTYVRLLSFQSSWQVHAEPPGGPTWPVIS